MTKKMKKKLTILFALLVLVASQIACDVKVDPTQTIGGQAKQALEGSPIDPN